MTAAEPLPKRAVVIVDRDLLRVFGQFAGLLGLQLVQLHDHWTIAPSRRDSPILTRRQAQMLLAIAEGKTNQQIADELVVSLETVKTTVRNLLRRLDVKSRQEAVAYAARHGLLPAFASPAA
jgi:DNA-binding NarL/FixJ family response regulator